MDVTAPTLDPLLAARWSTRVFDPDHELDDAELASLLEAARWAPSAGNSQPWAFLVARRGAAAHDRFVATLSRGNAGWVPRASAVLVSLHRSGHEDDPTFAYSDYAAYDLGQAVAHLTVQAQSLGLSVHQFAGFDHAAVADVFGVPAWWTVTTGIAVGRYGGEEAAAADPLLSEKEQRPRVRRPLSELAWGERFGVPVLPGE